MAIERSTIPLRIITILLAGIISTISAGAEITWDSSHPVLVQKGAHYGRIARLNAGTLVAGYDLNRAIHISLSQDEGKSWDDPVRVAGKPKGTCTNTEILVLKNGDLLCFFNFRPDKGSDLPYSICFSRSQDGGKSWSAPSTLYSAGKSFGDGCWEPAGIQLPGGEIQVYFANEGPYRSSNEQEISMLRSHDNGKSWSTPETISFRKNSRDGMPVPVVARNGNAIALAIEDNGLNGRFKPVIVSTRLDRGGWKGGTVSGESPFRWSALATPLPAATYAGAPYLRQFPDGRFILSYQMAASGEMHDSKMVVSLGSDRARDFGEATYPFPNTTGRSQLWNALFIKDASTVIAISETTLDGARGIWTVEGKRTDLVR